MLKFLAIRDFVIVSSLELDFSSGFTALTGETGAGKSILIDALSLALGERGDAAMVRNGCERAEIAAEFDIAALPHLQAWLAGQELAGDEGVCLLRRVLDANGRSRGFINGCSATLQQMRDAGEQLLDIHGQHAHQSLVRPDAQRMLLDGYAGIAADAEKVATLYRDWQALRRRRISLSENAEAVAAMRSGWLTSGPRVAQFEEQFAAYCGIPHGVAVSSCTAALVYNNRVDSPRLERTQKFLRVSLAPERPYLHFIQSAGLTGRASRYFLRRFRHLYTGFLRTSN